MKPDLIDLLKDERLRGLSELECLVVILISQWRVKTGDAAPSDPEAFVRQLPVGISAAEAAIAINKLVRTGLVAVTPNSNSLEIDTDPDEDERAESRAHIARARRARIVPRACAPLPQKDVSLVSEKPPELFDGREKRQLEAARARRQAARAQFQIAKGWLEAATEQLDAAPEAEIDRSESMLLPLHAGARAPDVHACTRDVCAGTHRAWCFGVNDSILSTSGSAASTLNTERATAGASAQRGALEPQRAEIERRGTLASQNDEAKILSGIMPDWNALAPDRIPDSKMGLEIWARWLARRMFHSIWKRYESWGRKVPTYMVQMRSMKNARTEKIQKAWIRVFRHMMTRDDRTPAEIVGWVDWVDEDPFWQFNILSPGKLRIQLNNGGLDASRARTESLKRKSSAFGKDIEHASAFDPDELARKKFGQDWRKRGET